MRVNAISYYRVKGSQRHHSFTLDNREGCRSYSIERQVLHNIKHVVYEITVIIEITVVYTGD